MPLAWFPAIGGGSPEQLEIARFLLDRGVLVNAHKRGQTALHWAARGGHVEMADLLLAAGADVNAQAKLAPGQEATPLAVAQKGDHKDVADLLRRHGGTV
jgi:ankyrin repeat protein